VVSSVTSHMLPEKSPKSFWNKAAEENPYWYVSSYGPYVADRDLADFWDSGRVIWNDIKRVIGYTPKPDHAVVEIGCGVGRLTRVIAPEVGCVIALDVSEKMLAIAKQVNIPNAEFREVEGFSLPAIPDNSADLALAYCVFQHLPSQTALKSYLVAMCRVVKPEGMIAFTLVARDWTVWLLPALRAKAYLREHLLGSGPKGVYRKEWVGIRPSTSEVSNISPIQLEVAALDVERIIYFGRTQ
jgi:SAM-dependent methyltransferase